MGLYNELIYDSPKYGTIDIQFKFGERWLHKYKLGDEIIFRAHQDDQKIGLKHVFGITIVNDDKNVVYYKIIFLDGKIIDAIEIDEKEADLLDIDWPS